MKEKGGVWNLSKHINTGKEKEEEKAHNSTEWNDEEKKDSKWTWKDSQESVHLTCCVVSQEDVDVAEWREVTRDFSHQGVPLLEYNEGYLDHGSRYEH